jgi:nitrite reductase/ring-hydroxylating ferredoxin subunit
MNNGRSLFLLNRSVLNAESYEKLLEIETTWISKLFQLINPSESVFQSRSNFLEAFDQLLLSERNAPSSTSDYVSSEATLSQFKIIIQEFAVDGLTEAQSFLPIIPRLPLTAQMPVLRILIDEFGCGNLDQSHSKLYVNLLSELGMSTDVNSYLDELNPESYDFLNIFYWLTQRAASVEYFLGALAYLESMVPHTFRCFAVACQRLSIMNSNYYTEHIHIDSFHAKDALRALQEVESAENLCYSKVWQGVQIASLVTAQAFEAAALKSKKKATQVSVNAKSDDISFYRNESILSDHYSDHILIKLQLNKYMIQQNCPHRGGKMRFGVINEKKGTIVCPLHFSKFDIKTGMQLSGPDCSPLHTCSIT